MKDATTTAFNSLFRESFKKCFGIELLMPISETEAKHFSNQVMDSTGLVIGAKSLKNYAAYVLNPEMKPENPSVATMDTLARYVLNAPYTDEVQRKNKEAHYPYWYQYRNSTITAEEKNTNEKDEPKQPQTVPAKNKKSLVFFFTLAIIIIITLAVFFYPSKNPENFSDDFHTVREDSLKNNGWFLRSKDEQWWAKRKDMLSNLTLFTLRGDNWKDSANSPEIKNLLLRKINSACFTVEIHLDHFVPMQRWQQAGILLMEDTNFSAKCVRVSLAFNDFFGGLKRPKEIIIQGISSNGKNLNNPEEIIHFPVFSVDSGQEKIVTANLSNSALRIEKNGIHFRFLYAAGQVENFAFKEVLSREISIQPRYIAIFALQGFVNDTNYIPAHFKFFSFNSMRCE
jgi:hypothetical protein